MSISEKGLQCDARVIYTIYHDPWHPLVPPHQLAGSLLLCRAGARVGADVTLSRLCLTILITNGLHKLGPETVTDWERFGFHINVS